MDFDVNVPVTRRGVLRLGGGAAAGLVGAGAMLRAGVLPVVAAPSASQGSAGTLPVDRMEDILDAEGTVNNGVLSIGLDRTDIGTVHIHGVPIKPSFEVNGALNFQPIGHNRALFNGDLPLKDSEVNGFIDEIIDESLVFQAEHQHFYDMDPPVWFIHWRGVGEPLALARAVRRCIDKTSTPLPQAPPANPSTPFDAERLQDILHGYRHDVGSDGVVTVYVARRNPIHIGDILVQPDTNIAHNISFEPLNSTGSRAAAAPDFGMEAGEVNAVVRTMRRQGWDVGCLYNQETDEHPQLFFSHMFNTGDPYDLAAQVRRGLDRTNTA
jgi:hypothetical protein